jgi:Phosphopantetheine attachment site
VPDTPGTILDVLSANSSSDRLVYVFLAEDTSEAEIRWAYADIAARCDHGRGLMAFRKMATRAVDGPLTHDSLRAWLVADLALRLQCAESEIDTAKPFDAYGLDLRNAVQISGALGKVVHRQLSPAILFDHGTINELSDYLTDAPTTEVNWRS